MADDDPGNVTDTKRRFEIYVPSPEARINLGAPNKDDAFGYTGVSLHADDHLFIDTGKHTLFQSGQNYCGQVGAKWLQYASADMIMSSAESVNLSADKKLLLAAGAGQGQITAISHGSSPRSVSYNALGLAYRLDRIQVGLFEFFHGRRKTAEYTGKTAAFLKAGAIDDLSYFDGKNESKDEAAAAELTGGFLKRTATSLRELYPVATERALGAYDKDAATEPDPIVLLDPLVSKRIIKSSDDSTKLQFGFTPYFNRFDPYSRIDLTTVKGGPITIGLAKFRNLLAWMRRFADVCGKYALLITDNKLGERAQKLAGAVDNLAKATSAAFNFIELPFGAFMAGHDRGAGGIGGFADERDSGMMGHFERDSPSAQAADAAEREREKYAKKRAKLKAKVTSSTGPFDLGGHELAYWTLTIATEDGSTKTIDLGGSPPTRAQLSGTIDVAPLLPTELDVSIARPTDGTVPGWITDAALSDWIAEELGLARAPTSWTSAVTVSASVMVNVLTLPTTDSQSIYARARTFAESGTGAQITVAIRQVAFFSPVHRVANVQLGIDGTEVTVALRSADLTFSSDATKLARDRERVRRQITAAVSPAGASVSGSDADFTITSGRYGAQSELVVVGAANPVLRGLGLRRAQRDLGSAGSSGLSGRDLSKVTAAQILAEIGSSSSFSASESDDALVIESAHAPETGKPSRVAVSGTLAAALFSSPSDEKAWNDQAKEDHDADLASSEARYKALLAWNNDLQSLPEDTRNLTRPIQNAVNDVVTSATALEKASEAILELVGKTKGFPSPPEAIGLIAEDGISLGTPDRIVGAGGKGIVFIADGGSGHEDHARFIPKIEQFVNLSMEFDAVAAFKVGWQQFRSWLGKPPAAPPAPTPDAADPAPSLGFRVLSDSTVDLMGTNSAQLMALGRGKLGAAGPDGKDVVGTGIARVAGSYAAELAAYRKVVISARNAGKDDKTGGRVEMAGQTIAIGGMNLQGDTKDFDSTKDTLFGIAPLDVADFAGVEHLSDTHKAAVKKEFTAHAWPETLRNGGATGHPDTQRVFVHAAKETVIQVGAYYVHVDAEKGVTVGTRTADPDPTKNVIDKTKPSIQVTNEKVQVTLGDADKDPALVLTKDFVHLHEGPTKDTVTRADLSLEKGVAELWGGKSFVQVKEGMTTLNSQKVSLLGKTAVEIKADGTIKLG